MEENLKKLFEYEKEINIKSLELKELKSQVKTLQDNNNILIQQNRGGYDKIEEIIKLKQELELFKNNPQEDINTKNENKQLKKDLQEMKIKFDTLKNNIMNKLKDYKNN